MNNEVFLRHRLISVCLFIYIFSFGAMLQAEPSPPSTLTSDNVNLTGRDFFRFYTSQDKSLREKSLLYLLGVEDATEGKAWCSYRQFKTVTLQEFIFEYFKKLPTQQLDERASKLIEEALRKNFPCKVKP